MAVNCTISALVTAAETFAKGSDKQLLAVMILADCAKLNGTTVSAYFQTNVNAATAAGYTKMSSRHQLAVLAYLRCRIANM